KRAIARDLHFQQTKEKPRKRLVFRAFLWRSLRDSNPCFSLERAACRAANRQETQQHSGLTGAAVGHCRPPYTRNWAVTPRRARNRALPEHPLSEGREHGRHAAQDKEHGGAQD